MFSSQKVFSLLFLVIFVFSLVDTARSKAKQKSSKKAKSPKVSKKPDSPKVSKKADGALEFTVPIYFAARGPSLSAAEYLNRVYPGIRYPELSKTEHIDISNVVNITLGTPPQKLSVRVQTSGNGLWTYEKGCYTRFVGVYKPEKYYKKRSKTEKLDERAEFHDRITDTFTIGKFTEPKQQFVAATSQTPSKPKGFLNEIEPARLMNAHGVLELGFPQEKNGMKSPFQNMLSFLKEPVYTVWIRKEKTKCGVNGQLTFGGFNQNLCNTAALPTRTLNVIPKNGKWTVKIEKFFFEEKENNLSESSKNTASFELGSSHIYAPRKVVDFVLKKSGAKVEAGVAIVDCGYFVPMADFIFHIDGQEIKIPARHLVIDIGLGNNRCALAIDESKNMDVDWILGDPFMRMFCTVFDQGKKQIRLVKSNEDVCEP